MSVFGRSNSFSEGAAPTKLFQTRSEWGVVISWTEPDTGTPVYGILFSQTVCAIQALANCTAPTLLSALLASSATSPSDARAAGRTRAVCKDQHPSNHAVERGMCRSRNGTWKSIEVNCESHMNALAHKSVYKHTSVAASGMLNLAKSVEMAGEFALLRKCVEDVAYRKMVVYRGVGDDDDRLYRQMALKVLIPNSRGSSLKRAMFLSMLPNGNWRNIHAVEIFLPFGQLVVDMEEFKRDVARGVARCLCSKIFFVYAISRWNNSEESACGQALLEVVHGIGPEAYTLYAERRVAGARRAHPSDAASVDEALDAVGGDVGNVDDAQQGPDTVGEEALVCGDVGGAGAEAAAADGAAARHARFVASALALFNTKHPCSLTLKIIWRMISAPLQAHMRAIHIINSDAWEAKQRSLAATRPLGDGCVLARDFRILTCVRGHGEDKLLVKLRCLLFGALLWELILEVDVNNRSQCDSLLLNFRSGRKRLQAIHGAAPQVPFQDLPGVARPSPRRRYRC
jgi:hypothetical protein